MNSSRVVMVRGKGVLLPDGEPVPQKLSLMFEKGFSLLYHLNRPEEAVRFLFQDEDTIGVKINTIAGKSLSTRPQAAYSLAELIKKAGLHKQNIIIWDRTNRELKEAGYSLHQGSNDLKVFGTDTQGVGYDRSLTSHRGIGSLFSAILSRSATASISLAILKDHGLAGITAGMKNYFGAIHNPNKYHDSNCNPFIAELFDASPIKKKHKISILDALIVQYHRGPSFHPRWAEKFESLVFSLDPVAADFIGWQVIERLRSAKGLPSLKEEGREPAYLKTAETLGLGKANRDDIEVLEAEV